MDNNVVPESFVDTVLGGTFGASQNVLKKSWDKVIQDLNACENLYHDEIEDIYSGELLDTFTRDLLCDVLAKQVLGMSHWPIYGDSPDYKEKFIQAMESNGFIFIKE